MTAQTKIRFTVELDKDDDAALTALVDSEKLNRAETLRRLIRKANRELAKAAQA